MIYMYHRILDKSNTTSDTSEAELTYPSEAHESTFFSEPFYL